jgi:hypothetical protein
MCSGAKWPLDATMLIYWAKSVGRLPNRHCGDFLSIVVSGGHLTPMRFFFGCMVLNGWSIMNPWFLVWRTSRSHPILIGLLFTKHLFTSMCRAFVLKWNIKGCESLVELHFNFHYARHCNCPYILKNRI